MKTINLRHLTQAECLQFCNDVVVICQKHDLETLLILSFFIRFKSVVDEINVFFKQDNDVLISLKLKDLDNLRDTRGSTVRGISKAYINHYETEKSMAGLRIVSCFDKYGKSVMSQPYQVESSSLDHIYEDLTTTQELIDAVAMLGLVAEVEEMKAKNDAFKVARMQRLDDRSKRGSLSFSEHLENGIDACSIFFGKVKAAIGFNESIDYSSLVNDINVLIDETTLAYNMRTAAGSTPKGTDEPEQQLPEEQVD